MLKLKKQISILTAGLILAVPMLSLAKTTMTASGEDGLIHVYGSLDNDQSKELIVKVLKKGDDSLSVANIADCLIAIEQKKSAQDGSFNIDIPVSADTESAEYTIELTAEGSQETDQKISCYYLKKAERDTIIGEINGASSYLTLQSTLTPYRAKLNLTIESIDTLYQSLQNPTGVYEKLYARKEEAPIQTAGELQTLFYECCVLEALQECQNGSEALTFLKEYKEILGIDLTDLNQLKNQEEVGTRLLSGGYASAVALQVRFDEVLCAVSFNQAIRSEVAALLKRYETKLSLPSAYTSASTEQKNTFYKDVEAKKDFSTYQDIKSYIKNWFSPSDGNVQHGGGGGGGGGSSLGTVTGGLGTGMTEPPTQSTERDHTSSALTPASNFQDLRDVPWAIEAIEYLANKKVIQGVSATAFEPNREITREEFVKILIEAFGVETHIQDTAFEDVDLNAWYAPYVCTAEEKGIVMGVDEKHFGIGTQITRQDMAVMICRTAELLDYEIKATDPAPNFDDQAEIAEYAKDAVALLCSCGAMNGVGENIFAPHACATRAMAAKVIYLIITA